MTCTTTAMNKRPDTRPPEEWGPHRAKKNRKKHCRGRVDIPHQWGEFEFKFKLGPASYSQRVCEVCGKKDIKVERER